MIVANMMLGINSLLAKIGYETIPPFLFAGIRYFLGGFLILFVGWFLLEKIRREDYRHLSVQVALQIGAALCWYWALTFTQAVNASIIFLLVPIMVYVGSVLFLGEPRSNKALMGALLAFSGGMLLFGAPAISNAEESQIVGNGLLLVSAAMFAALILHSKKIITENNIRSVLGLRWFATGIVALIVSAGFEDIGRITDASMSSLLALVLAVTLAGGIGVLIFYKALEHMKAEDSASILYIDPLIGSIAAALIIGETLSSASLIAALVVVVGVIITHPVHIQRTMYYLRFKHSRFEDFVRWAKHELDSLGAIARRFF